MVINCDDCKLNASCGTKTSHSTIVSCGKFTLKSSKVNQTKSSSSLTKTTTCSKKMDKKSTKYYSPKSNKNKVRSVNSTDKKARMENIIELGKKVFQKQKETDGIDNHQKNNDNWEKRKILKDIEIGRGGPDIAGLKKMHGEKDSKIIADAKKRLLR